PVMGETGYLHCSENVFWPRNRGRLFDFRDKAIAALGYGFDKARIFAVPENLARHRSGDGQIRFIDERVGPKRLNHLLARDYATTLSDQQLQRLNGLGSKRDNLAAPAQNQLTRVEFKLTKYVLFIPCGH